MKVYCAFYITREDEANQLLAIFSTEERANSYLKECKRQDEYSYFCVEPFEVDEDL